MEKQQPNYYSILPANVRYDNRLKANEKLLFSEITALTNSSGACYASNGYFAELYNVSKVSISLWVKNLIDCGYIKSKIVYKKGSKEILNRYLTILIYPIKENLNTPIKEILKDNNTSINNTSIIESNILFPDIPLINKKEKVKKSSEFSPPEKEDVIHFFIEKGYSKESAETAFNYYDVAEWHDASGNKVKNWKQKMIAVWFKPDNKENKNNSENKGFNMGDY